MSKVHILQDKADFIVNLLMLLLKAALGKKGGGIAHPHLA